MSLLDDVSIVVTPNGYKAGELYAVIPSDGAADMDVTRATAATRVDENGLVNYAEVVSDTELVTNGDFATDSNWNKGTGTTISGGTANLSNATAIGLYQDIGIQSAFVKVTFDVTNYTSGTLNVYSGSNQSITNINVVANAVGNYVAYVDRNGGNVNIVFGSIDGFTGSIDNVSIKEVTRDNVPRIDYTGGGGPHILAEPQRTNLIQYSEDLSTYLTTGTTVSTITETSPIESVTPFLITETATSKQHYIGGNSVSLSGNNTIYCFVKNVSSGRYFKMWGLGLGGANEAVIFDTNTETIYEPPTSTLYVVGSAKLEDYSNGWFRCSITVNTTITNSIAIGLINTVSGFGNDEYLGDITKSVLITGVQLEAGSYPTSYIPTSGSAVTRNQDQFTRDGIGSLINSTEGVLFVEMAALANDGTFRNMSLNDGTTGQAVRIYYRNQANKITVFISSSSNGTVNVDVTNTLNFNKIAISYKVNDVKVFINGSLEATITNVAMPVGLNTLSFDRGNNLLPFFGKVKQLQVYDTALTDNQLIQLTGEAGTHFFESYAEMASALTYTIQ